MTKIGVYPGTFDPVTNGHMDVIKRALNVVDKLVVAVAANAGKDPLFSAEERVQLISEDCMKLKVSSDRLVVKTFDNLLIDFVREQEATMIMRGLRAVTDFEYEFQMAGMNARLAPDLEAVFLMASDKFQLISSRFVKEVSMLNGDVSHFVSANVAHALQRKYQGDSVLRTG